MTNQEQRAYCLSAPLTPFNSSPFSRGSRAVHQGQKKAKSVIINNETDTAEASVLVKDGCTETNPDKQVKLPDSPPSAPDSASLTPSAKGILKRRRDAEMDNEEGAVSCSKKKVIFANPISESKIIDNVLVTKGRKNVRRRKLRYDDTTDETDCFQEALSEPYVEPSESLPTLNEIMHEDCENSEPGDKEGAKKLKVDSRIRKITRSSTSALEKDKASTNNNVPNSQADKVINAENETSVDNKNGNPCDIKVNGEMHPEVTTSQNVTEDTKESELIFRNLESLLMKIESSGSSLCDTESPVNIIKEKFASNNITEKGPKPDNEFSKKISKLSCLLTPSKLEIDFNCVSRLDPSLIIPKASIVIKRLTEELFNRLLGKERNQEKGTNQTNHLEANCGLGIKL